ncbi:MAG: hypothetical protein IRZ33_10475 [Alicyclobacillaceae bacterium]|nr:hypothetical protein [Alicyclobacillaceae bacterium]
MLELGLNPAAAVMSASFERAADRQATHAEFSSRLLEAELEERYLSP